MSGDSITLEGTVVDVFRGGFFAIDCAIGGATRRVLARLSGRLVQNHIRVVPGDLVTVDASPYDLSRGRIVYRGRREERAT